MKLPDFYQAVNRRPSTINKTETKEIYPSRCNPNEDCTHCWRYPCPTFSNPGRKCRACGDNPACLARKAACKNKLVECVAGVIGTAAYAPACAGCLYAVGWGPGLALCAEVCLVSAASMQLAIQNCS